MFCFVCFQEKIQQQQNTKKKSSLRSDTSILNNNIYAYSTSLNYLHRQKKNEYVFKLVLIK